MPALMQIADKHGLLVIEDASQAFGASLHGRNAGSFGAVACFSMNPMKVFAACGEAGMVVTDHQDIYDRLVALRYNGTVNREVCIEPSLNGRLDTLQAAILLRRLADVDRIIRRRREIAAWYDEQLAGIVETPREAQGEWDVYYTYTIRASQRDELKTFLEGQGIETKIQHPILMPDQPAYRNKANGEWSNARRLVQRILCIPAHEKLTRADVNYVAACIREFYNGVK
jgi:dTDP-4-amino-4,6-dideoxygalactose transaminase